MMFNKKRVPVFFSIIFILILFQFSNSVVLNRNLGTGEQLTNLSKNKPPGGKLVPDVNFGKIPLYFIHNKGQLNKKALFYAKTPGYTLWITKKGLIFDSIRTKETGDRSQKSEEKIKSEANLSPRFASPLSKGGQGGSVHRDISRLLFIGANKNPSILPLEIQKLKVNYFKGNDKSKWVGNIPTSGAVLYKSLYKNIDLKVYGIGKQIEYDWIVNPGGNPDDIRFEYKNVKNIKINKKGDLDITTQFGKLTHKKPYSYQDQHSAVSIQPSAKDNDKVGTGHALSEGEHMGSPLQEIPSSFKKLSPTTFGFTTGKYDKTKPLIIDPFVLLYSTCLGGSGAVYGNAVAADNNGYVYVTGQTYITDFPIYNEYQATPAGDFDIFISKIDTYQSGTSSLLYSTYLGGDDADESRGIAIDNNGNVYVTGNTRSLYFPTTPGGYQTSYQGGQDAFVTKIDTNLSGTSSLIYSTYLGDTGAEYGQGIAVDNNGYAYITGSTDSLNFPATINGYQKTNQGFTDIFITKLDANGASLLYSTYLGGNGNDYGYGISIDDNGNIYVTGMSWSSDFPTPNGYQTTSTGAWENAFASRIDTSQSGPGSLIYSTYLGGTGSDYGRGIAADNSGYIYVTGNTASSDFPTLNEYQEHQGNNDAFVTKIDTNQSGESSLLYSTYLGGSTTDNGYAIAIDSNGYVYTTGYTSSSDFPTLYEYQGYAGGSEAFITKIDTGNSGYPSLIYSTYLGGNGYESGSGIDVDINGNIYVSGTTMSSNFPVVNEYQGHQSYYDAFVSKLAMANEVNSSVSGGNGSASPVTQTVFEGYTASINLNPAPGYMIGSINDNGVNAVVQNPYRIYNVQENHDVVVTFKELVYKVTAEVEGGNGEVSPATQWVKPGENSSVSITPYTGYRIASITDNGNTMSISSPYIIYSVHANHFVKVRFLPDAEPPEITLTGSRKTDGSWTIKKEYAELKINIVEHPVKPLEIGSYVLFKNDDGKWKFLQIFDTGGEHTYIDIPLKNGEKVYYKIVAYVLDGSRATESKILEL